MTQANGEFAAGSQAGSVGRRLDGVQSEVGSNCDLPTLHTDGVQQTPPTQDDNPFDGVFVLSESSVNTASIYDVFSLSRGTHH